MVGPGHHTTSLRREGLAHLASAPLVCSPPSGEDFPCRLAVRAALPSSPPTAAGCSSAPTADSLSPPVRRPPLLLRPRRLHHGRMRRAGSVDARHPRHSRQSPGGRRAPGRSRSTARRRALRTSRRRAVSRTPTPWSQSQFFQHSSVSHLFSLTSRPLLQTATTHPSSQRRHDVPGPADIERSLVEHLLYRSASNLFHRRGTHAHAAGRQDNEFPDEWVEGRQVQRPLWRLAQPFACARFGSIHTKPIRPASAAQLAVSSIIARNACLNAAIASSSAPACPDITAFRALLACAVVIP